MGLNLIVTQPMPAGTILTLDTLDDEGNPRPLERIDLDEASGRVEFENVGDLPQDFVLSLVVLPGDSGAHTGRPFFKPGTEYVQNKPFAAPEVLGVFKCEATARHPRTGGLVAFGFGTTAYCYGVGDNTRWHRVAMTEEEWDRGGGWVQYQPPAEVGTDSDPQYVPCPADCDGCSCAARGEHAPCAHCEDNHLNRGRG
jgi:hypothetical protein